MGPDTALGKEPQCLTGVGAFLDSENLYFQTETLPCDWNVRGDLWLPSGGMSDGA
jgi:hypothetical protein